MKRTIAILFLMFGSIASFADVLTVQSETGIGYNSTVDYHLSAVSSYGYFWHLRDGDGSTRPNKDAGNAYALGGVYSSITTAGNNLYDLEFNTQSGAVYIKEDLYFNTIYTTGNRTSYTLNFDSTGSLNATNTGNGTSAGGNIKFTQNASVSINVIVSEEQLNGVQDGALYTRTLISSFGTGTGMWNVWDNLTGSVVGLDGYEYKGKITDINKLTEGQWGFYNHEGDTVTLAFVKAIPEPTTATLSLLALAGLAMRRRRR